jgi:rsbT co-antagonist protein RsbR
MRDMQAYRPRLPQVTAAMAEGLKAYWAVQESHEQEITEATVAAAGRIPEFAPILRAMSKETLAAQNAAGRERSRRAFLHNEWEPYLVELHKQGETYARMGVSFNAWIELIRVFKDFVTPLIVADLRADTTRLLSALGGMNELLYLSIEVIGEAYLTAKEGVIRAQEEAIRELSTPVLRVRERVLIVPVVGIVDTQRARQITENMLRAVKDHRARVVVMDITGVPVVDSKVAGHLLQSVEAARLMGTEVLITGLSPEIAQTLVTLGAVLTDVKTYGDLQDGMEKADAILGLEVVARHPTTQGLSRGRVL